MKYLSAIKNTIFSVAISALFLLSAALVDPLSESTVLANNGKASLKAMKLAEQETNGKAVKTKYVEKGSKKGYKVRILKEGKVSHIFIGLDKLK